MKKLLLLLALFTGMVSAASAQVCTVDSSHFTAGTVVYPATLPCITQGAAFSGTVTIRIPDSLDASIFFSALPPNTYYLYVDSVRLDSITGSPAGISANTNPGSGAYLYPGQYGCVQFSGTTNAAVGSFPVSLYGSGCVHGSIGGIPVDSCQTGLLPAFVNFALSVCAPPAGLCTVDSTHFTGNTHIYPTSLPCITDGTPYTGTVSIQIPDSVDASLVVTSLPAGLVFVHIDSIRLDSITGMPTGISALTSTGDTAWLHGGQFACGVFSGVTHAPTGNYPIDMYGRGCVHGSFNGITIDTCIDRNIGSFFTFSLNICGPPACTVDTTQFSSSIHVYPPVLPCIITNRPYSGQINIQVPDSLDISDIITIPGFTIPPGIGFIHIDSIDIASISGDPAGITSISNPVLGTWLQPSAFACAVFSGTVLAATTSAGNYPLTISGTACGHANLVIRGFPINVDTCMQNFNFAKSFPYSLNVCYPAGITQVTEGVDLNIYPNPNQGNFTVTVASSDRVNGTMSVIDQVGRTIKTQSIDMTGTRQIPLDLGNVSAGAYLLMITTGESRSVKQFIVR